MNAGRESIKRRRRDSEPLDDSFGFAGTCKIGHFAGSFANAVHILNVTKVDAEG